MSFFSERNKDAETISPDSAATGPLVGFLDSFSVAFEEQTRAAAVYGIENEMWKLENDNRLAMKKAGVADLPMLNPDGFNFVTRNLPGPAAGVDAYLDTARFYEDGGEPEFAKRLQDYDSAISKLQEDNPDLKLRTSRQMWDTVKGQAQKYEQRFNGDRTSTGGSVGSFAGSMVGVLSPNSDPWNFATLPVGSFGKSVAARIGGQGAAQGFIEGFNQLTGVQEQRELLGVSHGLGDALTRVSGAAVGGAALQGLGELVYAGGKRWFRDVPGDEAPKAPAPDPAKEGFDAGKQKFKDRPEEPALNDLDQAAKLVEHPESFVDLVHEASPLADTKAGRPKTALDLDQMEGALQEWGGPAPWEVRPRTHGVEASIQGLDPSQLDAQLKRGVERAGVEELVKTGQDSPFPRFVKYVDRRLAARQLVDAHTDTQSLDLTKQIKTIDDEVYALMWKSAELSREEGLPLRRKLEQLRDDQLALIEKGKAFEPLAVTKGRLEVLKQGRNIQDMAPLIEREYARAKNEWDLGAEDRAKVLDVMRDGEKKLGAQKPEVSKAVDAFEELGLDKAFFKQLRRGVPKLKGGVKRPVGALLKGLGGVDPSGRLASELKARGVDAKSSPGLFKREGLNSADTLVLDEYPVFRDNVSDDGNGYVKPDDIADALADEQGGTPWRTEEEIIKYEDSVAPYENVLDDLDHAGIRLDEVSDETAARELLAYYKKDQEAFDGIPFFDEKPSPKDVDANVTKRLDVQARTQDEYRTGLEDTLNIKKDGTVSVRGEEHALSLDNDKIFVPDEDGTGGHEMTIRELLEDHKATEQELEAVSVCSTHKTS